MTRMICLLCLAVLLLASGTIRAQRPDFTTWLNVGAEYELKRSGFTLESGL